VRSSQRDSEKTTIVRLALPAASGTAGQGDRIYSDAGMGSLVRLTSICPAQSNPSTPRVPAAYFWRDPHDSAELRNARRRYRVLDNSGPTSKSRGLTTAEAPRLSTCV
jgi:hypothetical protein